MTTWEDIVRSKPLEAVAAFVGLLLVTLVWSVVLRRQLRRATALRQVVLAVALSALVLAILSALAAARLMLLEATQAWTFVSVLAIAAGLSVLLALLVAHPLGQDVQRLESTVRRVEAGDRSVRTGVIRHDELGHVAQALDDLVLRLDELERERSSIDRERRAVLSSIGHDLRTPLTALRVAIEALIDGVAPDPARYLRAMEHDAAALSALVDDLFLLARLDAGTLELDPRLLDLGQVVEEAVRSLSPVVESLGLVVNVDPARRAGATEVLADANAIGRVVRILLDNAFRHAPTGSTVRVVVEPVGGEAGAEAVVVRVCDEGPGFPDEFVDRAFLPLSRADPARARSTGGSGLGLAIARGIISAHHGRIWIEPRDISGPQRGAEVAFRLATA